MDILPEKLPSLSERWNERYALIRPYVVLPALYFMVTLPEMIIFVYSGRFIGGYISYFVILFPTFPFAMLTPRHLQWIWMKLSGDTSILLAYLMNMIFYIFLNYLLVRLKNRRHRIFKTRR